MQREAIVYDFVKKLKQLEYKLKVDSSSNASLCKEKGLSKEGVSGLGRAEKPTPSPNSAKKPTSTPNSSSLDGVHGSKCKRWTEPLCENRYLHGGYDPKCKQWILRMEEIKRKEDIELEEWLEKIKGD